MFRSEFTHKHGWKYRLNVAAFPDWKETFQFYRVGARCKLHKASTGEDRPLKTEEGEMWTGVFLPSLDHVANIAIEEGTDVFVYTKKELERHLLSQFGNHGHANAKKTDNVWEIYCLDNQPQSMHWTPDNAALAPGDPDECRRLLKPDPGTRNLRVSEIWKCSLP